MAPSNSCDERTNKPEAQQERKPAWHDAPNEPGYWVCSWDKSSHLFTQQGTENFERIHGERWYGPIPEDKETP